jgi:hypothetical protein
MNRRWRERRLRHLESSIATMTKTDDRIPISISVSGIPVSGFHWGRGMIADFPNEPKRLI